ncbi:hypothetical protein ACFWBX_06520 [Streptomyces sp. NPDC059991]|uniref:hypothetical protein n=1 Tax=Streptomyces sp. NPDC059991 TaxID=3347028 RepID=UPI0036CF1001
MPGAPGAAPDQARTPGCPTTAVLQHVLGALRGTARAEIAAGIRPVLAAAIDEVANGPSRHAQSALAVARAALQWPADARQLGVLTEAARALEPFVLDPAYEPPTEAVTEPAAVYAHFTDTDPRVVRTWMSRLWILSARTGGEVVVDAYDVGSPDVPLAQRPYWQQKIVPRIAAGFIRRLVISRPEELLSPATFPTKQAYAQAQQYMAAWFTERNVLLVSLAKEPRQ